MRNRLWKSSAVAVVPALVVLWWLPRGAPVEAQAGLADAVRLAAQIDAQIASRWQEVQLAPAPLSNDAEFFRRLYLDVCGVIPPPLEARQFIESRDPQKRAAAIDRLLTSPAAAAQQANLWEARLIGRQTRVQQVDRDALRAYLVRAFTENKPYDVFARELITATGTNDQNGAANYILRFAGMGRLQVEDLTSSVSRLFLGTQIQCAQCHDHKSEKWKQEDFHALAAFFARTRGIPTRRPSPTDRRPPIEVRDLPFGEQQMELHSGRRETVYPKFLEGVDYRGGETSRREALAKWMTAPDNPWFARAAVNRVWDQLLGHGLIDPPDDLRESNPPSHPELMALLTREFTEHAFDLRSLMRGVLLSRTYQLSSRRETEPNPLHARHFVSAPLRQLTPEQLFDSLFAATGMMDNAFLRGRTELADLKQRLMRFFVLTFDTDENEEADGFDGTIPQALMMMNGDLPNRGSMALPGSALATILNSEASDRDKTHAIYLRVLGRFATPAELGRLEQMLARAGGARRAEANPRGGPATATGRLGGGGFGRGTGPGGRGFLQPATRDPRTQAFEDLYWALLNSSEFIFNH